MVFGLVLGAYHKPPELNYRTRSKTAISLADKTLKVQSAGEIIFCENAFSSLMIAGGRPTVGSQGEALSYG